MIFEKLRSLALIKKETKFPHVQGARGIDARFLKLSPASAVSPILTKFSQYIPIPPATQN